MEAIVKVSHLVTDDGKYDRGDLLDLPEERIISLGSSVERVLPTVAAIDERDTKIAELEGNVKTLEDKLAAKEGELAARQKEIKKLLKEKQSV